MAIVDDDNDAVTPVRSQRHEIGQALEQLSVEDLRERLMLLQDEISRLNAQLAKKEASREAADAFFSFGNT